MMHQPVQDRRCQLLVVEYRVPFDKGQVGRSNHTPFLVAFRYSFKQQLGARPLEGDVAPFVQDQDVCLGQFFPEFALRVGLTGFDQKIDQAAGLEIEDLVTGPAGFHA